MDCELGKTPIVATSKSEAHQSHAMLRRKLRIPFTRKKAIAKEVLWDIW
jgi:hypothetical protein